MKQLINYIRDNLDITQREAKSTLAFLTVAAVSLITYLVVNKYTTNKHVEFTLKTYAAELPPEPENNYNTYSKPIKNKAEFFPFNPNTASKDELQKLGIPHYVANTIIKYRNKGGSFKYKSDLQKIYSLKPETYALLYNYIDLPIKSQPVGVEEYKVINTRPKEEEKPVKVENKPLSFDINQADTTTLKKVRGIGSVYAGRIVRFRDALGGFHNLNQLDETYGISPEALLEIKKVAQINSTVEKININTVSNFKHPYLKAHQIKAIIAYRNQHGAFSSVQDLRNIKLLNEETIEKITPYLSF